MQRGGAHPAAGRGGRARAGAQARPHVARCRPAQGRTPYIAATASAKNTTLLVPRCLALHGNWHPLKVLLPQMHAVRQSVRINSRHTSQADVERSLRARIDALLADDEEGAACDPEAGDAPEAAFMQAPSGAPPLVRELPRRVFAPVKVRSAVCLS